jgi:hypothetical protein
LHDMKVPCPVQIAASRNEKISFLQDRTYSCPIKDFTNSSEEELTYFFNWFKYDIHMIMLRGIVSRELKNRTNYSVRNGEGLYKPRSALTTSQDGVSKDVVDKLCTAAVCDDVIGLREITTHNPQLIYHEAARYAASLGNIQVVAYLLQLSQNDTFVVRNMLIGATSHSQIDLIKYVLSTVKVECRDPAKCPIRGDAWKLASALKKQEILTALKK